MATAISERMKRFNIYKFVLTIPGILLIYSAIFLIYFLLRNSDTGNNPIFFQLGDKGPAFRWYGIIITVGVIMAAFTTQFLAARRGENPERTWVLLPIVLVTGIAGARLWYVINTWAKYKDSIFSIGGPQPGVFEVWRGGIAIQGAVIGAVIGVVVYKWIAGLNFLRWADFIAPGLILAQACGRWGNFMNNEAYGSATSVPWGVKIPCDYRTTGGTPGTVDTSCSVLAADQRFHPTFFYESIWDYAVFLTLLFAITRPKTVERWTKLRLRDGDIFFLYLVLYSIGRFIIESLRTDPLYIIGDPVNGGIRSAQMLSIVFIFVGAFFFLYRHRTRTPDAEALSVKVRPQPTKRELRQQQLALATASAGGAVLEPETQVQRHVEAAAEIEETEQADPEVEINSPTLEVTPDGAEVYEPLSSVETETEAEAKVPELMEEVMPLQVEAKAQEPEITMIEKAEALETEIAEKADSQEARAEAKATETEVVVNEVATKIDSAAPRKPSADGPTNQNRNQKKRR